MLHTKIKDIGYVSRPEEDMESYSLHRGISYIVLIHVIDRPDS